MDDLPVFVLEHFSLASVSSDRNGRLECNLVGSKKRRSGKRDRRMLTVIVLKNQRWMTTLLLTFPELFICLKNVVGSIITSCGGHSWQQSALMQKNYINSERITCRFGGQCKKDNRKYDTKRVNHIWGSFYTDASHTDVIYKWYVHTNRMCSWNMVEHK